MKEIYKSVLFERNYLVAEDGVVCDHSFEVLFSFASLFHIRITSGMALAQQEMIAFISDELGISVPEPFYRGFPASVRKLSPNQLLFDQLFHYTMTYGLHHFEHAGHSLFEGALSRSDFSEETKTKEFAIITEAEARDKLTDIFQNLMLSSRPLNDAQYAFVLSYVKDFDYDITQCMSKNTAVRLLSDSRQLQFLKFLSLSDVIKLVDDINYRQYGNENIKKLNLKNQDRKFITKVINELFDAGKCDLETCCEKKAVWNGLLHHIHYQPRDEISSRFVACMRGKENVSVYARFEKAVAEGNIQDAVVVLQEGKGTTALLRRLSYLMSRCTSQEDVDFILKRIESDNVVVLLQLLLEYAQVKPEKTRRDFIFTLHNKAKIHRETNEEASRRKSIIPADYVEAICNYVRENLHQELKGRLGKVYIDPDMQFIALPLQENTAQGGIGVLPKGSRLKIAEGKKVRAFTYWEKVDDIDLSVIGLDMDGRQMEFSWRTMYDEQSAAITYSGDETSGYEGGSEYFDIELEEFKDTYPNIRYLIFSNNVFSGTPFSKCLCKAGYMIRDIDDSGEVYEPKTVQSSYVINCESTFAHLFGIDLVNNDFVWLNTAKHGNTRVAGTTYLDYLTRYFDTTSIMNMALFFEMMATELVNDPAEAEVVVSDKTSDHVAHAHIIRSCDFDQVLAFMNAKQ